MSPAVLAQLRPTLALARGIWWVSVAIVPIAVFDTYLFLQDRVPRAVPPNIPYILVSAAAVSALLAFLNLRFYPPRFRIREVLEPELPPETLAKKLTIFRVAPERIEALRALSADERRVLQAAPLFLRTACMCIAQAGTIAICGFLLTIGTYTLAPLLYFAGPGLLAAILVYPRIEPFMARVEAVRAG